VTVKPNGGATPNKNVAKVIGAGKAKREAATNQRRGLNSTGKATPNAIKKAINKATTPGKGKGNKPALIQRRPAIGGAKPVAATGLKITFKPKELGQTTPQQVIQQVRVVYVMCVCIIIIIIIAISSLFFLFYYWNMFRLRAPLRNKENQELPTQDKR